MKAERLYQLHQLTMTSGPLATNVRPSAAIFFWGVMKVSLFWEVPWYNLFWNRHVILNSG